MSLTGLYNGVLLFSNPSWTGAGTVPVSLIRNITDVAQDLGYELHLKNNLTTLSTNGAQTLNGVIQGLLYVPDISTVASCNAQQYDFIPHNVTRRAQLPPANYNLIALAPWFSIDCVQAFLASARLDPIRAFIFYKPNNSTDKPQGPDSAVWNLDDGGAWKESRFPIFAIPGIEGQRMMTQLSLYSGTADTVPHGAEIMQRYGTNQRDYVRIWAQLTMKGAASLPSLWVYFLIVIGALLFIVASVSLTMHFIQRRRRTSLRKRVESGEVDLEAMGIKRLTIPASHVKDFPLFTYTSQPELAYDLSTPTSEVPSPMRPGKGKKKRRGERHSNSSATVVSDSVQTLRSQRSAVTGTANTTATNYQPQCHICLAEFEDRFSVIRELPCHHIFHPICIDEFLLRNSSLCPMCKQCMLPPGYSPKITNGMVRRERALRKLRERVEFDDSSMESGDVKFKGWGKPGWGKRLFHSSSSSEESRDIQLEKRLSTPPERSSEGESPGTRGNESDESPGGGPPEAAATTAPAAAAPQSTTHTAVPQPAASAPSPKKARPRKSKARPLHVLPTQPEGAELRTGFAGFVGRSSPSSFARERMREIANQNAPFDDPDQSRPKWRRAVTKVFPGL
ncbi:RING finger domain-containing protein [Cordyceps militaris CM01]|uniref:RING-type E3 ubiquitin transferase n=2 Tax=Cordyceps militaris TaxID=73501 RepID=G3J766_CORMM|nr:RING finger domain-containing protein [Cordyceps militaris CM01]EGX95439.1 RING finger domain-containing protein [Cordyceps militaris CM01]